MIQIEIPGRRWYQRKYKRALPTSFAEVPQARLLRCLGWLLTQPRDVAMPHVLKEVLNVPYSRLAKLGGDDLCLLLHHLAFMEAKADPTVLIPSFEWKGVTYYGPADKFANCAAIEYPLADEFYTAAVTEGDDNALLKLVATLYREGRTDANPADKRVPLLSRAELEARAKRLDGMPLEIQGAVLLYFAGVKALVYRVYGPTLFDIDPNKEQDDNDDEDDTPNQQQGQAIMFGWWGLYMDVADNMANLDKIHQTNFHNICMYLVKRRKEEKERAMQARLSDPNFGGS